MNHSSPLWFHTASVDLTPCPPPQQTAGTGVRRVELCHAWRIGVCNDPPRIDTGA